MALEETVNRDLRSRTHTHLKSEAQNTCRIRVTARMWLRKGDIVRKGKKYFLTTVISRFCPAKVKARRERERERERGKLGRIYLWLFSCGGYEFSFPVPMSYQISWKYTPQTRLSFWNLGRCISELRSVYIDRNWARNSDSLFFLDDSLFFFNLSYIIFTGNT
jgi:hypothetical protein